jgi:hypothetical protein
MQVTILAAAGVFRHAPTASANLLLVSRAGLRKLGRSAQRLTLGADAFYNADPIFGGSGCDM